MAQLYCEERFAHPRGRREAHATAQALVATLDQVPHLETILDLPCGNGRFTTLLAGRSRVYVGADVAREMLDVAVTERRRAGAAAAFVHCEGERLPFGDDAFDCVACIRFLNLVPGPVQDELLAEMRRVSRRWLIVQSHRLKRGPAVAAKRFVKHLLGRDTTKYDIARRIRAAGWEETRRVPVRGMGQYVGLYRKPGAPR